MPEHQAYVCLACSQGIRALMPGERSGASCLEKTAIAERPARAGAAAVTAAVRAINYGSLSNDRFDF